MTRAAIPILALLLAACHADFTTGNSDANVTVNADENGSLSFNLPFANGKVKLPEGALHGGKLDIDGVEMMPGASVTGFALNAGDKGATVHMAFTAPKSPDEVRAYFLDQFKAKGVQAAQSGDGVTGKSKDGSPFTIKVASAGQGSQGTIDIQDKD